MPGTNPNFAKSHQKAQCVFDICSSDWVRRLVWITKLHGNEHGSVPQRLWPPVNRGTVYFLSLKYLQTVALVDPPYATMKFPSVHSTSAVLYLHCNFLVPNVGAFSLGNSTTLGAFCLEVEPSNLLQSNEDYSSRNGQIIDFSYISILQRLIISDERRRVFLVKSGCDFNGGRTFSFLHHWLDFLK